MKYNIAVVDDVISDGELLQKEIRKCFSVNDNSSGFVTSFSDGETLLKDFEPGKFQIIFMDIMMSSISGIEAAKQIRASDSSALIVFT
ncbi:MAG: response regulator, partial [Synergistaceae bacterium]|nr:response regulator [Synergistaceae bacterium]